MFLPYLCSLDLIVLFLHCFSFINCLFIYYESSPKNNSPTNNSSYIGRVISFYFVFVFVFVLASNMCTVNGTKWPYLCPVLKVVEERSLVSSTSQGRVLLPRIYLYVFDLKMASFDAFLVVFYVI